MIRPMSEYGQLVHDAFQSTEHPAMNQSFFEQKQSDSTWPTAARESANNARVADRRPAKARRTGLSSGSTGGSPSHLHHRLAPVR